MQEHEHPCAILDLLFNFFLFFVPGEFLNIADLSKDLTCGKFWKVRYAMQ